MPFTYTNQEYSDMVFVYDFCNGSANAQEQSATETFQLDDVQYSECSTASTNTSMTMAAFQHDVAVGIETAAVEIGTAALGIGTATVGIGQLH